MACAASEPPPSKTADDSSLAGTGANSNANGQGDGNRGRESVQVDPRIANACDLPETHFAFDSARIKGGAADGLEALARCFVSGPLKGKGMKLVGHADPRGEIEYNFGLGQQRAGSVARFLQRNGVPSSRIATSSRGEVDATGDSESGWAHDRRVEVLLAD